MPGCDREAAAAWMCGSARLRSGTKDAFAGFIDFSRRAKRSLPRVALPAPGCGPGTISAASGGGESAPGMRRLPLGAAQQGSACCEQASYVTDKAALIDQYNDTHRIHNGKWRCHHRLTSDVYATIDRISPSSETASDLGTEVSRGL